MHQNNRSFRFSSSTPAPANAPRQTPASAVLSRAELRRIVAELIG
jgi:hypothetical protein